MTFTRKKFLSFLGFFLTVLLPQVCGAGKPFLSPNLPEIFINENEPLELRCSGFPNLEFYYPKDVGYAISTSPAEVIEQIKGETKSLLFRRENTVHGDTGWYGCAEKGTQLTPGTYDQEDISWTYVYVKSETNFFVQMDTLESVRGVVGGSVTIPCRPTSPTYNVTLLSNHDTEIEIDENASYDPKIGLRLKNISLKDSGYLKCLITINDDVQEVNYHLLVLRHQALKKPEISTENLQHVIRGQKLQVNCTINVGMDLQYVLNWTTPQRSDRITQRQYRKSSGNNHQIAVCELTIDAVTDEDEGDYQCSITTFSDTQNAKVHILVHDPNLKFINLTSLDEHSYYQRKYNERIEWTVYFDAYPRPILKWLNPRGDEIIGTWLEPEKSKYAINASSSLAWLRINRLNLADMGVYTLQATNDGFIETLNFTLDVIAKPIPMLERVESFYLPKVKANFRCNVAAFPAPEIVWKFIRAPAFPSMEGLEEIILPDSIVTSKITTFSSTVSMEPDTSGNLICEASNEVGNDSVVETILLSDVPGGFGIKERNKEFTVGDDVIRTCAASIYNYTDVDWLDKNEEKIFDHDNIFISKEKTDFTYHSTLHLKNISNYNNNSHFVCAAKSAEIYLDYDEFKLELHDPSPPYFIETNMNKTEVTYDLNSEGHKSIVLKCYVQGMPLPNVTWYKDGEKIIGNDQFMCLHRYQELWIKYLLDKSGGKYSCVATNRFGREENFQTIVITVKEISLGLLIGIGVLVAVCIILVIVFSIRMHRERVIRKQLMEAGLTHFEEGALECLNPDLTVDDQAEFLPYDRKWEFPRDRLKFGKQLGFGAFGVVMKADAQGIRENEPVTTVAVKMVRRSTESTYIKALASELKIMVHLGKHLNVVNLLGACTKNIAKRELLVIVEYCRFGNLHNYLLRHRAGFIDQIDRTTGTFDPSIGLDVLTKRTSTGSSTNSLCGNSYNTCNSNPPIEERADWKIPRDSNVGSGSTSDGCLLSTDSGCQAGWRSNYHGDYKDQILKPICTQDLLSWAFQVARGMEYLSQRKVLHGDLAARNILLAENNIVKICDFGLAKTMYKDDNYKKKGDAPLPIKWMAIESIRDRIFSTQSDVWSFGVVLWEFFTLAETPYPGMEAEKQYQRLIEGYRMEQPIYATDELHNIMLKCWKAKPSLRPSFTDLVMNIGGLLEESVKEHYVHLNVPYMDMNTLNLESGTNDYLTMMSAPDHDVLSSPTNTHGYVNFPQKSSKVSEEEEEEEDSYTPMNPSLPQTRPRGGSKKKKKMDEKEIGEQDEEERTFEATPMLGPEDDNYLKPINVSERRAAFAKSLQNSGKTDKPIVSNYCNANFHQPGNFGDLELSEKKMREKPRKNDSRTAKNSSKFDPVSFSNPSYTAIDTNRRIE